MISSDNFLNVLKVFVMLTWKIIHPFLTAALDPLIGSLRNDDADGNDDATKQ